MQLLEPNLKATIFDYNTWNSERISNPLYRLFWFFGDATEPHFQKTLFGGIGVLLGSIIAYVLDRKKSRFRGTPIAYGTGSLWLWILAASSLSLGISILLFGSLEGGWVATFVPYVSVASAVILLYGGNIPALLTGAALGALFCTPIAMFLRVYVVLPLGLPGVIANVNSMWMSAIIVFEICKILPWMKKTESKPSESTPEVVEGEMPLSEYKMKKPGMFFLRRMLADYSEPMFVGNEIAGGMLVLGSVITWLLNPNQPSYGSGLFPAILLAELLTGAVALIVYWEGWRDNGWFPTFVPVVSAAPAAVLTYGGSMWVIVISAIVGALSGPPIALMLNRKLPAHWHGVIGLVAAMAISTALTAVVIMLLGQAFPIILGG
jgi:hypothetical protein